jgi:hypothetical protein
MKLKAGSLFFILTIIFIAATIAYSTSQDEKAKNDSSKIIIDVNELGDKIGVVKEETVMPDGNKALAQKWDKAAIQKAMAELKRYYTDPTKTYFITNSPHPAFTLAFIQAMQPLNVQYLYMNRGGDEVEMCTLKKVKNIPYPAFNYGVRFEIKEDGDKIFMNFNSDSPEATALKQHSFDIKNTCKLAIPEIPKGKHLFLHAKGRYAVMVPLAFNYIKDTKSISIARHDDDYTCAVSFSDKIEVGEVTKRTLPDDL